MSGLLTPKQRRFVEEYLLDANAAQAAVRAGYSEKTARSIGCELLTKPDIAAAIAEARSQRSERTQVTADAVVTELANLGFANMLDYLKVLPSGDVVVDLSRLTRAQAAAIGEVTIDEYVEGAGDEARTVKRTRFKLVDKKGALDSLGKHLGIFRERIEFSESPEMQAQRAQLEKMSTEDLIALAQQMGIRTAR